MSAFDVSTEGVLASETVGVFVAMGAFRVFVYGHWFGDCFLF